jgi:hypothetical protein
MQAGRTSKYDTDAQSDSVDRKRHGSLRVSVGKRRYAGENLRWIANPQRFFSIHFFCRQKKWMPRRRGEKEKKQKNGIMNKGKNPGQWLLGGVIQFSSILLLCANKRKDRIFVLRWQASGCRSLLCRPALCSRLCKLRPEDNSRIILCGHLR